MNRTITPEFQLHEYPQPAAITDGAQILSVNEKAAVLFPMLTVGAPLPDALTPPEDETTWEGFAVLCGRGIRLRGERRGDHILYTFSPQEQTALSEGQLDSVLYHLRKLTGDLYTHLSPCISSEDEILPHTTKDALSADIYRLLRLLDHLDLLRDAADCELSPAREQIELGQLCSVVCTTAAGILREIGVELSCRIAPGEFYLTGDSGLLRGVLLELISNCAGRVKQGGQISLSLHRKQGRAVICITDNGGAPTSRDRVAVTARGTTPLIPIPGTGAGLGLSVAEQLVRAHGGALFFSLDDGASRTYISLPTSHLPQGSISLHTSTLERNAGMSPYLLALSELLPGNIIREDWKD